MPNNLLTIDQITREAAVVLHQQSTFLRTINREHDKSFGKKGAKIGDTLRVRLPNRYTVTNGRTLNIQETNEQKVDLKINNRKHVGLDFTQEDLTLSLDDFSDRILRPAMSVLAADVEADVITNLYKQVPNQVNNVGGAATYRNLAQSRQKLVDNLSPQDDLSFHIGTQTNVDLVDTMKTLFHDNKEISSQFRKGYISSGMGFDYYESTHMPRHVSGTDASGYQTSGGNQTGSTLTVGTGSGTFKVGDIITIADVYDVHPETKAVRGYLKQFVITADAGPNATSLSISPAIYATGALQNVSNAAATAKAITKVGGNAAAYDVGLAYHRDAFMFATADLEIPPTAVASKRVSMDGLSLAFVQDFDITNYRTISRIDIMYGYGLLRSELATRLATN
jgi:hypothetical protein